MSLHVSFRFNQLHAVKPMRSIGTTRMWFSISIRVNAMTQQHKFSQFSVQSTGILFLGTVIVGGYESNTAQLIDLAIINDAGECVFQSLVRPEILPNYVASHGIELDKMEMAPPKSDVLPELHRYLLQAETIVVWNGPFTAMVCKISDAPLTHKIRCARSAMREANLAVNGTKLLHVADSLGYGGPAALSPRYRALNKARAIRHIWLAAAKAK